MSYAKHWNSAPSKINAVHLAQLNTWAEQAILREAAIMARMKEERDRKMCMSTTKNTLKTLKTI